MLVARSPASPRLQDDSGAGVWSTSPVVDVQLSSSEMEEAKLQKDGYQKVTYTGSATPANLNEGGVMSSPILLWYRRRSHGGSGVRLKAVVDLVLSKKKVGREGSS